MRVIAGTYRSRQLVAPRGAGTRPTSDRLRETLFNILSPRVAGCHFADLYAGTGAVGIEALSRGAAQVWFAERAAPALAAIRDNLKALKIVRGFVLEERGTGALLQHLANTAQKPGSAQKAQSQSSSQTETAVPATSPSDLLDLVFLDPPWEAAAEYTSTLHLLGSTRGHLILAPGALVIAEHSSKSPLAACFGELEQTRTLKQGDATLSFYARIQPLRPD